ncbi:universal stress protein [Amnibacterium kyonggiense]|uniref:Nucleotide-binding universal stress UspA family protein n=1 Tax=Amnibacterium kyonggiense TaxID=595671 RepID=A0A4R7FKK2_9MICO|nr:universal stress protein [Amnibacterium kyonggiense]TDS76890.1 nucleotide-binding universal stress UspA family protein [Amnibacterium kyonggiense]
MDEGTGTGRPVAGRGPRVVVGVDGSRDSIAALRAGEWAAAIHGGTLVAVCAWTVPTAVPEALLITPDLEIAARDVLHDALVHAFHGRCSVPVDTVVRGGRPASVLVEQAADAVLVVVGSRGLGGFTGLLMGSVSMGVAAHANCPVLVMHDGDVPPAVEDGVIGGRVVVGDGGSAEGAAVIRTAAVAAARMRAELDVLAGWEDTTVFVDPRVDFRARLRTEAMDRAARDVAAAFPDGRPPRLHVDVREGPAARVLVEASRSAALVVVGRSSRREFAGALLGSVALAVAEHASSPVLVVPATTTPPRTRQAEMTTAGA